MPALVAGCEDVPRSAARRAYGRFGRPMLDGMARQARVWKYRALSDCTRVSGAALVLQPVLYAGTGRIEIGAGVRFGWRESPDFYTGYSHVEVAGPEALVRIGDGVEFSNSVMVKSEGAGVEIGRAALIGSFVEIFDSDFHDLHPDRRRGGAPRMAPVTIGENVFLGMGVRVLKGVTIGRDSVIGAGSVVVYDIPAGVIAAGNPARVVREL
ncbi:MAG TPA: DapH/DapD/GlmU-related protein [Solirubrobacterales bacterium]|nr:DapH/DapD/GlmU-related protein [Solirubrobacterales bacterium]